MAKQGQSAWALSNGSGKVSSLRHIYETREDARAALRFAKDGNNTAGYATIVPVTVKPATGRSSAFALADDNGINVRYIFGSKKQAKTVMSIVNDRDYGSFESIVGVTLA
jgi:hypothetical protein